MKNSFLFRMAVLVAAMMCALGGAAAEAYACYTSSNKTLTFYYDNQRNSRPGETFDLNTGDNRPQWSYDDITENVSDVVFHSSFASARPTTTSNWFAGMALTAIEGFNYLNTSAVTNMANMFADCVVSEGFDLSHFNTANVTDMTSMFEESHCESKLLNLSSFDTHNVTVMDQMFAFSGFKTIIVGDGWTTENVSSGYGMFALCGQLVGGMGTTYKLVGYDGVEYAHIDGGESNPGYFTSVQDYNSKPYAVLTTEGEDLGFLQTLTFYNDHQRLSHSEITYGIEIIDVTHQWPRYSGPEWYLPEDYSNINQVVFDPSFASARPKSTYNWFAGMRFLYDITGIEYLNTSEVTDMASMFKGCGSLRSLDLSHFNTGNVTTMEHMFDGCNHLEQLDVSHFNTGNVTTMEYMFSGCESLTALDVSHFNTGNVTNMGYMFNGCESLTALNVGNINTGNVTNMGYMFNGCESLTALNVGNINTSNVTTMEHMFNSCESLISLDVSHFDTGNVTDMSAMFIYCKSLNSIDLSSFDTQNVTNMFAMFFHCQSLRTLDLSSFNTTNVTTMSQMFQGCTSLETIIVGNLWSIAGFTNFSNGMFRDCTSLVGGQGTTYDPNHYSEDYAHIDGGPSNPGYLTDANAYYAYACYTPSNTTLTFYYDNQRTSRPGTTYSLNAVGINPGWYTDNTYKNVTKVVFDASFSEARPKSTASWFARMTNLTSITGLSNLNTSYTESMDYMFYGCTGFTSLDLTGFQTINLQNMEYMFFNCTNLTSVDLSSFNTSRVTNMNYLFRGCSHLTTIYAGSRWTTSGVTAGNYMFTGCTNLVGGRGTAYDASHVDKTYAHIDGGSSNPGYFTAVDYGLSVGGVDVTYKNASNITGPGIVSGTASYNPSTRTLTLNNVNITLSTTNGIKVNDTFDGDVCYINLVGDNHLDVTNYYPLYFGKATTITGNGTLDMGSGDIHITFSSPLVIEGGCTVMGHSIMGSSSGGETLTVNGSLTSVSMSHTIWGLASLTLNDGLSIVKPVGGYYDPSSRWMKNANGTNCSTGVIINDGRQMYAEIYGSPETLTFYYDNQRDIRQGTTYDLNTGMDNPGWYSDGSSYGVTKVVFDPSFARARPTTTYSWFTEMQNLTHIEGIQYLNTSEVTDMSVMFDGCEALTSIDLSHFNTAKVTDMSYMFNNCSSLTSLNLSNFNTAKVTGMTCMFNGCSGLTSLNVSSFNTSNVTRMYRMFRFCSGLTSLDVSSFNTSNVTDMCEMFYGCEALTSLDLSDFNTAKVTDMKSMFYYCGALKTIYAGDGWSTAAVTSSYWMFTGCTKLVGGMGTTYSASHTDKTYAHIDGGPSNPGYFTEKGGTFLRGDVNGDGHVTISDVTALIDLLLGGGTINNPAADCNNDSNVTISDVTALIDYLLGGSW